MTNALPFTARPDPSLPTWLDSLSPPPEPARRTRIVCTLGPSSDDAETLIKMVEAGMDVARFNFSHGSGDFHRRLVEMVRRTAAEAGRQVALMQDLQGPKLRIGALPNGPIDLEVGSHVALVPGGAATARGMVPVPCRQLVRALEPGDRVVFGDGEIEVGVVRCCEDARLCEVVRGGLLGERKGIAVPGRHFAMPILTRKDIADLEIGRPLGFDYVALSFVRTAADVASARKVCRERGWSVPLVAKLETQESLSNLDEILAASDAVMIARGDLGVELPLAEVPAAQKQIVKSANRAGVPVITATQMLESMVTNSRPTRAEATDVANAIWDGSDAVMLSAETSAGHHPVESVRAMSELCLAAERCSTWNRSVGAGWPRAVEV